MDIDYNALFDIIENDFYYKNTDLGILATISTANGKEDVSINSDKFISIITSRYRKRCGMIISPTPIKNCIRSFQGDIVTQQEKVKNPNRYIHRNHEIWIDAANKADAYFVVKNKLFPFSVRLKSYKNFSKHSIKGVIPLSDINNADINRIFKYCRVPKSERTVKIPSAPNRLSREINNLRFEFQKAGVTIEMSKTPNNSRYIRLSLEKSE